MADPIISCNILKMLFFTFDISYRLNHIVYILYSMTQYSSPLAVLNQGLGVSESVVQILTEFKKFHVHEPLSVFVGHVRKVEYSVLAQT